MTMATPSLLQKKEVVYDYGHPSLASRRGKRCLASSLYWKEEVVVMVIGIPLRPKSGRGA